MSMISWWAQMAPVPARVDKANWCGWHACWKSLAKTWAIVRDTTGRKRSPMTNPRTPPDGFCKSCAQTPRPMWCWLGRCPLQVVGIPLQIWLSWFRRRGRFEECLLRKNEQCDAKHQVHVRLYLKLFKLQDSKGKPTPEYILLVQETSHGNACPQINHYSVQVLERGCPQRKIRGTSTTNPTSQALNMFKTFVLQNLWKG